MDVRVQAPHPKVEKADVRMGEIGVRPLQATVLLQK